MVTKQFYIFLFLITSLSVHSQRIQTYPLSLSKAIEDGLASSFNIQIADYEVQRAKMDRKKGPFDRFPSINFNIGQSNRLSLDNSPTSFTDGTYTKNELSGTISTDWLLFGGHGVKIDKERLKKLEEKQKGDSKAIIETTIQNIILAYYRALIEKEKLTSVKERMAFASAKKLKAELDFNAERISKFDVNNFENDLLSDSIRYRQQEKEVAQSLIRLRVLLGYDKEKNIVLTENLTKEYTAYDYSDLESEMLANNTQLKNSRYSIDLLENTLKRKIAGRKPSLRFMNSLSNEISTSRFSLEDSENGGLFDVSASLSLSYKLYDGGKHKHDLQHNKIDKIIAKKRVSDLELRLRESLLINLENYNQLIGIHEMHNTLVTNLAKNLSIAEDRLDNGYSIFVEYRDAKLELARAQLNVLQTLYEIKMAEVEIIKIIGGIIK